MGLRTVTKYLKRDFGAETSRRALEALAGGSSLGDGAGDDGAHLLSPSMCQSECEVIYMHFHF